MQAVSYEQTRPGGLAISVEMVGYVIIVALAALLRLAELDTVPLTAREAEQALAAWRVIYPQTPGSVGVAESPLLFLLHSISFSVFGGSEATVRGWTALAGVFLVASPVLFRGLLGRTRAFLFALLLLFSPVLFAASRFDTPAVWAMLCAVMGLWFLWRWWVANQAGYALAAAGCVAGLVLLTDPAGFVLVLILLGAGIVALWWGRSENPESDPLPELRSRLRAWPWGQSLLLGVALVVILSTGFMLYMPGLSSVSELLGRGVSGVMNVRAGAPPLYPLVTALFYEPVLWLFAFVGIWLAARRGHVALLERFFAVWLVIAGVAVLLYQGGGPEHALWVVLPAAGLASWAFASVLQDVRHPFLVVPSWSRWVLAVLTVALLAVMTVNLQAIGRSIIRTPDGSLTGLFQGYYERFALLAFGEAPGQAVAVDPVHMIWLLMAVALLILGGFVAMALWGGTATLRGGALGLLFFGMVTSLGSGWSISVTNAGNPAEMWHTQATGREVFLLGETMTELARRENRGIPHMPVYVLADDNGVVAWLLRDYVNLEYITDASEARQQRIILLPQTAEPLDLGGDYVGQTFIITRGWNPQTLQGFDFVAWWAQGHTRYPATPVQTLVLWLRQDVYNGL